MSTECSCHFHKLEFVHQKMIEEVENLQKENKRLLAWLTVLETDVGDAILYIQNRSKGGQQVGHGPILSRAPMSVLLEIQRFVRNAKDPKNVY